MAFMVTYWWNPCRIKTAPRWNLVKPRFFSSCDLEGIKCSTWRTTVVKLLHISFNDKAAFTVFLLSPKSPFSIKPCTLSVLLTKIFKRLAKSLQEFWAGVIPSWYKNCSKRSKNLVFHLWKLLYFLTLSTFFNSICSSGSDFKGLTLPSPLAWAWASSSIL